MKTMIIASFRDYWLLKVNREVVSFVLFKSTRVQYKKAMKKNGTI